MVETSLKLIQTLIYLIGKTPKDIPEPESSYIVVDGEGNEWTAMLCFDFMSKDDAEKFANEFATILQTVFKAIMEEKK